MKRFTILMPFSRPWNVGALAAMWRAATAGMTGTAELRVLCHDAAHARLWEQALPGVQTCEVNPTPGLDPCYWKLNAGLLPLRGPATADDYFGFLCDDDTYDPGFFAALEQVTGEVLVCSARRFGGCFSNIHGVLEARPEHMHMCGVGLEQFFIQGPALGELRFDHDGLADGRMVEWLRQAGRAFGYAPGLFVNWNVLPGKL